ncbi:MAG: hypothetical protein WCK64_07305 [Synechococcaceae cyanobacterium ELA445]
MTPTELNQLDLTTISAVQGIVSAALRNQCCQWEQDSADAASRLLSHALMMEHLAFAAQLLTSITASEISNFFSAVLDVQFSSMPPLEEEASVLSTIP